MKTKARNADFGRPVAYTAEVPEFIQVRILDKDENEWSQDKDPINFKRLGFNYGFDKEHLSIHTQQIKMIRLTSARLQQWRRHGITIS